MENLRNQQRVTNFNIKNIEIKAEELFEKAIVCANDGFSKKAFDIARDALIYSKRNNLYLAIYIHSFMAALSIDFTQYGNARIHIYNAINRLNINHFNYKVDRTYLEALLVHVNKVDKEYKQIEFEAMAA